MEITAQFPADVSGWVQLGCSSSPLLDSQSLSSTLCAESKAELKCTRDDFFSWTHDDFTSMFAFHWLSTTDKENVPCSPPPQKKIDLLTNFPETAVNTLFKETSEISWKMVVSFGANILKFLNGILQNTHKQFEDP